MSSVNLDGRWRLFHFEEGAYSVRQPDDLQSLPVSPIPATVPGNVEFDLQSAGELVDPVYAGHIRDLRPLEFHEWWYQREFVLAEEGEGRPGVEGRRSGDQGWVARTTRISGKQGWVVRTATSSGEQGSGDLTTRSSGEPGSVDLIPQWDLVCEGIDTLATIWINGTVVGRPENSLIAHRFDVSQALVWGQENTITIRIGSSVQAARLKTYDAIQMSWEHRYEGLYLRKPSHCWGWDILPRLVTAGIWRSIRLEAHPADAIEAMYFWTASIDDQSATLGAAFQFRTGRRSLDGLTLRFNGVCREHSFTYDWPVEFIADSCFIPVADAQLWWPKGYGEPALYTITAQLLLEGEVLAERKERVGIRRMVVDRTELAGKVWAFKGSATSPARIDVAPDPDSHFVVKVNGQPVMVKGTNWVPVDAFHSRDLARIPAAFELVKDLGCNMIRCWGGNVYENDLFYNLCDENGVMVWQDFAFACCRYPQTDDFLAVVRDEVERVVTRLRNHASLAIWCGDNEIDMGYLTDGLLPEANRLTRETIPQVLNRLDPRRSYVPSSPYAPLAVVNAPDPWQATPEQHLWGPRGYYKSPFYTAHSAHFIGEIGYHGCPNVSSIRKFISPESLWPWQNNDEWQVHSVYHWRAHKIERDRIALMANQVRELFGQVPETLGEFALASQITQAEAKKFFIESTRLRKWGTSGIIWWNVLDGWPQFSDAIVDYYFVKKLAFHFIKRVQAPVVVVVGEADEKGQHPVAVCNDSRLDADLSYRVWDADSQVTLSQGQFTCPANQNWQLDRLDGSGGSQRMLLMQWTTGGQVYGSHYLMGKAPFALTDYRRWLGLIAALPGGFDAQKVGL
ncbi:MAG TPA: glycoside hydrolase family 2 TIM barrel-domain containing protein [Anaerolineaceae bacterium]